MLTQYQGINKGCNKPTSINTISALRIKSFITTFLIIYPNPKIEKGGMKLKKNLL
jgi:hypothetical protein